MTCPVIIGRLDNRCAGGHSDWPDTTCHYSRGWYEPRCARVSPSRCGPESKWCEVATDAPGGGRAAEGRDGPTRWRVLEGERWVGTHTDRAAAFAQAKHWRQIYGVAMRVVRVVTVQRRWRVGGELCFVYRAGGTWLWGVGRGLSLRAGCTATFAAAVEAAERAAKAGGAWS